MASRPSCFSAVARIVAGDDAGGPLRDWPSRKARFRMSANTARIGTPGTARGEDGLSFVWPVWSAPLPLSGIVALLRHPRVLAGDVATLRALGVMDVLAARRVANGKFMSVSRGSSTCRGDACKKPLGALRGASPRRTARTRKLLDGARSRMDRRGRNIRQETISVDASP